MVKRLPNWLKIGLQSRFGPNFVVEFEAFFRKKFGLAFCTYTYYIDRGVYASRLTTQFQDLIFSCQKQCFMLI